MAKAKLVTLADEITSDLNKGGYSLGFKAERTYKPNPELPTTDQVTVLVAMPASEMSPDNRTEWVYLHSVEIGVLFRGGENAGVPADKFDLCMKLVEEIADKYRKQRPTISDMTLDSVTFPNGAYIPEHMNQYNQFTGVIRLTFREWRT